MFKKFFPLVFPILVACSSPTEKQNNLPAKKDSSVSSTNLSLADDSCNFYSFDSVWINLETLEASHSARCIGRNFKTDGKYAYRFHRADEGDSVWLQRTLFKITNDRMLEITQGTVSQKIKLLSQIPKSPHDHPWFLLKALSDEVVLLTDDDDSLFTISGYNSNGNLLFKTTANRMKITHPQKNEDYYHNYLNYYGTTKREMVFTTGPFSEEKGTEILNLHTGEKAKYDFQLSGYFSDSNNDSIAGLIEDKDSLMVIHTLDYGNIFTLKKLDWRNECECILFGDLLFYSVYSDISPGASLECFNLKTGKKQWTADVLQVYVPCSSQYSNQVCLSLYKNKIIMEGDEAEGNYVQVFDLNSGKRLAEFGAVVGTGQH
jgi:hypothetical protein